VDDRLLTLPEPECRQRDGYFYESEDEARAFCRAEAREPPRADLRISGLTVSPATPQDGDRFVVRGTVVNEGNGAAADVLVELSVGERTVGSEIVMLLAPGERREISYLAPGAKAGAHALSVTADPGDWIRESNERNNRASKELMVSPAMLPDLVVEAVRVVPPRPAPGEPVTVTAVIANKGRGAARKVDAGLLILDAAQIRRREPPADGSWLELEALRTFPELQPGDRATIEQRWTAVGGEHLLRVEVDAIDAVREEAEDNNLLEQPLGVPVGE